MDDRVDAKPPSGLLAARLAIGAASVLGARFLGRRAPLLVGWAVTGRCDLRCAYCARPDDGRSDLDTTAALALAEGIARSGAIQCSLTGGEPLLRRDIGQIIRVLRKSGMLVGLNTNGRLLPERIDEVAGASVVTVSLDGPRDVHDAIRGTGSHRAAVEGIRCAVRRGMRVQLHAVLTDRNVDRFDDFLRLSADLGAPFGFAPVDALPLAAPGALDLRPDPGRLRAFMDRAIEAKRQGDPRLLDSVPCLRTLRNWPRYRLAQGCCAGRIFARIEPDGSLYGCGAHIGVVPPQPTSGGFQAAFDRLVARDCRSCWCDSEIEMNLLYGLDPSALLHAVRSVARFTVSARPGAYRGPGR